MDLKVGGVDNLHGATSVGIRCRLLMLPQSVPVLCWSIFFVSLLTQSYIRFRSRVRRLRRQG